MSPMARRGGALIAVIVVLCAIGGALGSLAATHRYSATAIVFAASDEPDSTLALYGSVYANLRMSSYAAVVTTSAVLDPVIANLDLAGDADALAQDVAVTSSSSSSVLRITVTRPSAAEATRIANAMAARFIAEIADRLESPAPGTPATVTFRSVGSTSVPAGGSGLVGGIVSGVLFGLLGGLGLAALATVGDRRLDTEEEVATATSTPIYGRIGIARAAALAPIADDYSRSEGYHALLTAIRSGVEPTSGRVVVVTSPTPGSGTTLTAVNLAVAAADRGDRTLLVDADLRHPQVAERLGIEEPHGLAEVLGGEVRERDARSAWGYSHHLWVLATPAAERGAGDILGSRRMANRLAEWRMQYDLVVLDTASVASASDALALARASDLVLVVTTPETRQSQLAGAIRILSRAQVQVGLVLNELRRPVRTVTAAGFAHLLVGSIR